MGFVGGRFPIHLLYIILKRCIQNNQELGRVLNISVIETAVIVNCSMPSLFRNVDHFSWGGVSILLIFLRRQIQVLPLVNKCYSQVFIATKLLSWWGLGDLKEKYPCSSKTTYGVGREGEGSHAGPRDSLFPSLRSRKKMSRSQGILGRCPQAVSVFGSYCYC